MNAANGAVRSDALYIVLQLGEEMIGFDGKIVVSDRQPYA